MPGMFERVHILKNFPPNYPLYKKIKDNIVLAVCATIPHPRRSWLTRTDTLQATKTLERGDVILVGLLKIVFEKVLREPVTHSVLYVGGNKCIQANVDGVGHISLHKIFTDYDSLAILRVRENTPEDVVNASIDDAESLLGKPYDFDFEEGDQAVFCTELINESFKKGGFDTGLSSIHHSKKLTKRIEKEISNSTAALRAVEMLKGNFDVVFLSHNLKLQGKKLQLIPENDS